MASSLNTLQQVKFNEALYILKTFGVEGNNDIEKLNNLAKLLNGKKTPEILSLADAVAQKNGITWTSTGPPSLGEMNIFSTEKASETDNNDIDASYLAIETKPISVDNILGPKAVQIIPKLVDPSGNPIEFSNATLETVMEVSSNGEKLITSKNLIQNNNFEGFTLRFASLPKEKLFDDKVDVKISVKTSKKTYQMTKIGVPINTKALLTPQVATTEEDQATAPVDNTTNPDNTTTANNAEATKSAKPTSDPKATVSKFLNNLGTKNLRAAYDASENPNWGSFDSFSNPTSGFGTVKGMNVKSISTTSVAEKSASVNATYDVTDNNGKTIPLQVTFGLKNVNGEWKISSYKIN